MYMEGKTFFGCERYIKPSAHSLIPTPILVTCFPNIKSKVTDSRSIWIHAFRTVWMHIGHKQP